ncbi:Uncharacterized conserved protein YecE, DUF72 family [Alteribacillus persepolensis]|uniref:Uncharacterized conserved protein YecE, DUF72 family n=1 Tax=Alteribacillus persepolensis TaxID=568899 RepID=A0A1G8DVS7_9BACI|nr:DUF72 domain-containing protein [Alteribacillus persepolensis]SDH61804.1 Uncharacterized conserved protein YecE, DUF72 family [Alteribacillus persepolensis]
MIYVGLTGWRDHDILYPPGTRQTEKLQAYSSHFPTVEVDAAFYAVQPFKNYEKWSQETPDSFRFIVKAYQGITGHQRGEIPFSSMEEMFSAYIESLKPLTESKKLGMVLCQFPPWFDCSRQNVEYLRLVREKLSDFPCALEFRHQSWFSDQYREKTLDFMKRENWIHSICDEPQIKEGSVPMVLHPTDETTTLIRLHGRNKAAWSQPVQGENWREVRYLYDYSKEELEQWHKRVKMLEKQSRHIYFIFNNNSGGHAAGNAKTFLDMAGIQYKGLAPRQLSLFDDIDS